MTAIVRCVSCGQLNRYPDTTARVRCAKCKHDLARPLSMGGGFATFTDDDDDDVDDLDDDLDTDDDDTDDDDDDPVDLMMSGRFAEALIVYSRLLADAEAQGDEFIAPMLRAQIALCRARTAK